jgi:hypothetical protein
MTLLGKILVFFVLVLNLVWAGMTVFSFATRTNWQNAYKAADAKAKEAAQAADYQRKLAEQERAAGQARVAALQAEADRLRVQVDTLTKDLATSKQEYQNKLTAQQDADGDRKILLTNQAQLVKQIDVLQTALKNQELIANDATVGGEKAKADSLQSAILREAALKRADELELKLLAARDEINAMRLGTGARGVGGNRVVAPDDFRATVTSVDGSFVALNNGGNAKLQKGAVLMLYRVSPAPKYLGDLEIISVDSYGAVGQFVAPRGVLKPSAEDLPRVGDTAAAPKP